MSARTDVEPPDEALTVTRRYLRRERPLSVLVAAVGAAAVVLTYLVTSLLLAVVVFVTYLAVVRAPIIRSRGTARLETDDDPEDVVDAFTGPTPPVLVFQWGIADGITVDGETVTYHISYLFGLRSVDVTVRARTNPTPGERTVELAITANDHPWASYAVSIYEERDRTVVEYEYAADRRFGLRRVPQRIVAERYRDGALEAQGYVVTERDERYGI
jgi:hypothetical protein